MEQMDYVFTKKNSALCRKELDFIQTCDINYQFTENFGEISYFKVTGMSDYWKSGEPFINNSVGNILNSFVRHDIPFSFVVIGNEKEISIYVGTHKLLLESIKVSYKTEFLGIIIEDTNNPLLNFDQRFGGIITGYPDFEEEKSIDSLNIEKICNGMRGKNFSIIVNAKGVSNIAVSLAHNEVLRELEKTYPMLEKSVSGGFQGNLSVKKQDFSAKLYFDNLNILENIINRGMSSGMWRMIGYYTSDNAEDLKKIKNLIKGNYLGKNSIPDILRTIDCNNVKDLLRNNIFPAEPLDEQSNHVLGKWRDHFEDIEIDLFSYKYQTILNSDQLSFFCQFPKKELFGFTINKYVEFDLAERKNDENHVYISLGDICIACEQQKENSLNHYNFMLSDFTRHGLIVGVTGGGKTNTSKSLLNTLWNTNNTDIKTPFLVIESAKREYWELMNLKGFDDLIVFTLGDESSKTGIKYRLNPFETFPNISLQTHIDYLLSTFKASFDLYAPLPYILEKAVYDIYSDRGWNIIENKNNYGLDNYPTLLDLYNKIGLIVDEMGYHSEVQSNIKTALQTRIQSLMIGGKGAMLNTSKSFPIREILNKPVVMELEDLGDDETKSFVIGLILVQLYEFRKSEKQSNNKELIHLLLVEEAHRLLKNVESAKDSSRAKSIEFFCNLLAEIRSYGQGIIIADQIPTKLANDTLKNTNLKIIHRTVAKEDRENVGYAMNMTEEQIEYLSTLKRGYAIVYSEGDNRPKCVKFPLIKNYFAYSRNEVITNIRSRLGETSSLEFKNKHIGCLFCENKCVKFEIVSKYIDSRVPYKNLLEVLERKNYDYYFLNTMFDLEVMSGLSDNDFITKLCTLGYLIDKAKGISDGKKQSILAEYLKNYWRRK